MTSRREILQIGLAASTLPVAGALLAGAPTGAADKPTRAATIPLHRVVFDARLAPARDFGLEAARRGMTVHALADGDVTDFWYHELDLLWRREARAIAGLTRHGPLFVLERFAWDRGLRVVLRAEHRQGAGLVEHRLAGPRMSVARIQALSAAGDAWSGFMAGMATQCAAVCTDSAEHIVVTPASRRLPDDEPLYSWVIAARA